MIRLLTAVFLFASFNVAAEVTLTDINNNEVADAEVVMGNFNALKDEIESLPLPPSDCSTDAIIRWNGSAWVCELDTLGRLNCDEGDSIRYRDGQWQCGSCSPPGRQIDDSNFNDAVAAWFSDGANSVYGPISEWCTKGVSNMEYAFQNASSFDEDISGWDVSNVVNMRYMFAGAESFNADISGWDTGSVTNMNSMFLLNDAFNQNIGGWDVSNVEDMNAMFQSATAFNGDISNWNTGSLLAMQQMFRSATSFNRDIGSWDVSNVTDMRRLFYGATNFNADLSSWDASSEIEGCLEFALGATVWLNAYGGSIEGKTPPLSASLIAAGCGE